MILNLKNHYLKIIYPKYYAKSKDTLENILHYGGLSIIYITKI